MRRSAVNKRCFDIPRRNFLKGCAIAAVASADPAFSMIGLDGRKAAQISSSARWRPLDFVDPIIGTGWHGHVFPGAVAPFGLVQLSPDTSGPPERRRGNAPDYYGWNHCSGYHYPDNVILGFSHTHLQGTGGSDLGDILVMPVVEGRNWSWDAGIPTDQGEAQIDAIGENSGWVFSESEPGYRSFFSHQTEMARAGYYAVHLETPDARAELTATTRCGMHRYSYPSLPSHIQHGIIVDLIHGLGSRAYHAELNIESDSRISGSRSTHGWAQDRQVCFVMEFSRPAASVQVKVDGKVSPAAAGGRLSGEQLQAIFNHTAAAEPLILRVGISGTSVEGARKNLAAEIPHWDFDGVVHQ
ncbi:MAG: hypothetical protein ACRD3F_02565, partial [Acidobacteriaceae bacterium]